MLEITIENAEKIVRDLDRIGGWTANTYNWGSIVASEGKIAIEKATGTWTHEPRVTVSQVAGGVGRGATATIGVKVDSETYQYVDKGTRANYPIAPKREGGVLAFNSKFKAKSRPNSLRAYKGMSAGPVSFRAWVIHPGIKARNFTKLAFEKARRDGIKIVDAQIAALIAGHEAFIAQLNQRYRG